MATTIDIGFVLADCLVADGRIRSAQGDGAGAIECLEQAKSRLVADDRPLQLGLVRLDLAGFLAEGGEVAAATAEARAAMACFERLGARTARDRAAALLRRLGDTGRTRAQRGDELVEALTVRENEVLELLREGLTNAEIAERLYISPKTAEHHVGRVLNKLGVRNRAEAAALAERLQATTIVSGPK